jgi:hypothetical protein
VGVVSDALWALGFVEQKEVMATHEDMDHAIQEGAVERRTGETKQVRGLLLPRWLTCLDVVGGDEGWRKGGRVG